MGIVQVSIEEVSRDLEVYLQRVEAEEMIVILKAGKPVAEIKPVQTTPLPPRPYGLCAGEFIVPDDFDVPLPESVLMEFEGR